MIDELKMVELWDWKGIGSLAKGLESYALVGSTSPNRRERGSQNDVQLGGIKDTLRSPRRLA